MCTLNQFRPFFHSIFHIYTQFRYTYTQSRILQKIRAAFLDMAYHSALVPYISIPYILRSRPYTNLINPEQTYLHSINPGYTYTESRTYLLTLNPENIYCIPNIYNQNSIANGSPWRTPVPEDQPVDPQGFRRG